MTNPHRAAGVATHGPAPDDAAVVVVAVHGRAQAPDYMLEHLVAPLEAAGLDGDRVAWLLPAAADQCWYPNSFLAPVADNQPWLDHALEVLTDLESDLADRPGDTVVWAGFSQGACLVSEHLARRPRRWGGLVALTGGMIGPEGAALTIDGSFDGMPVYFGVGDRDEWVPERRVHETAELYRRAGADVTVEVFPGREHLISPAEVERALAVIEGIS